MGRFGLFDVGRIIDHSGPQREGQEHMSYFEKFVTEGNEKADEQPKKERCGTKDLRHRLVPSSSQQERRSVRSFAVCSQLSLFGGGMERL